MMAELEVWLPEPLTVATVIEKLFTWRCSVTGAFLDNRLND